MVLADIDAPLLKSVTDDLSGSSHDVVAVPTDVSSLQAIEALRDAALDAFGAVHAWRGIMADRVAAMGDGVLHHGFGG